MGYLHWTLSFTHTTHSRLPRNKGRTEYRIYRRLGSRPRVCCKQVDLPLPKGKTSDFRPSTVRPEGLKTSRTPTSLCLVFYLPSQGPRILPLM